jgi:large subunit ribosomal protein L14
MFRVADNSGAIFVKCIRIVTNPTFFAEIGDIVRVVVKKNIPKKKKVKKSREVRKGQICTAVVVRTRVGVRRWSGFFIRFGIRAVCLINKFNFPIGSRVTSPVARELRCKFPKIVSLAPISI